MTDIAPPKEQIEEVKTENVKIKSEFTDLVSKDTPLSHEAWTAFVSNVNAASSKIDQVTQSLEAYKKSKKSSEAPKEDPNAKIFEEYAKLYNSIKDSLIGENGNTKSDVATSNFEKLIFTTDFIARYPNSNEESNPINNFILAIKNYSFNKNAKSINPHLTISPESESQLNHQLLKAVLDALEPKTIKELLPVTGTSYDTNDNLINAITALFNSGDSKLKPKILEIYTKLLSSQGGGSFSSSMSKKNRKSHKSYHPGIGKTKKHHHGHHKKISFVH